MDLSQIFTIGGKPGLQKLVAQTKNGVIVESLVDGKRFPAYANHKISNLQDISVYTVDGDLPLVEVFEKIAEASDYKSITLPKDNKDLKSTLMEYLPSLDDERVYSSDVKKMLSWYNLLVEKGLIEKKVEKEAKKETKEEVKEDK